MNDDSEDKPSRGFSRRSFLKGLGTVGIGTLALPDNGIIGAADAQAQDAPPAGPAVLKGPVPITLKINGQEHKLTVETRTTLLDALRMHLDLTGAKLVCDRGTCGACTVFVGEHIVTSCMMLAVDAQGQEIRTIEGLAKGDELHPVQAAFVEADALQCGFCTPGFVMACTSVLEKNPSASLDEIKEGIAGNICRCGTYNRIFDAALSAQKSMGAAGGKRA